MLFFDEFFFEGEELFGGRMRGDFGEGIPIVMRYLGEVVLHRNIRP